MRSQHDYYAVAENRHLVGCATGGRGVFDDIVQHRDAVGQREARRIEPDAGASRSQARRAAARLPVERRATGDKELTRGSGAALTLNRWWFNNRGSIFATAFQYPNHGGHMRLSTIAVAVSLALGATLMTACDRGADRSTSSSSTTSPSGATTAPGSSSSSASGTTAAPSTAPSGSSSSSTSIDLNTKKDNASGGSSSSSSSSTPSSSSSTPSAASGSSSSTPSSSSSSTPSSSSSSSDTSSTTK